MGEWHKYQAPNPNYPCTNCQTGWGNQSHKVVDGVDYYKSESCSETCELLRKYSKPVRERIFGENIRNTRRNI